MDALDPVKDWDNLGSRFARKKKRPSDRALRLGRRIQRKKPRTSERSPLKMDLSGCFCRFPSDSSNWMFGTWTIRQSLRRAGRNKDLSDEGREPSSAKFGNRRRPRTDFGGSVISIRLAASPGGSTGFKQDHRRGPNSKAVNANWVQTRWF